MVPFRVTFVDSPWGVGRCFHLTGQATHRVVQESSETHPPRIPAGIFLTGSFNLTSNLDLAKCLESQIVPYYFEAIVAGF